MDRHRITDMNTQGFYKIDNEQLLYGPNFVLFGDGNDLNIEHKDMYTYPVNDWYYFASEEQAKVFFNIE